jgi:hypothetical protein
MPNDATFESFEKELNRLVESFGKRIAELKQPGYAEAQLRDDFLNPFFRALGWDMENRAGLIQKEREVEIESATQIGGGRKRADYLFRTEKRERFVCEAKKPAEELSARYAFQAKRYAWNKGVPVAVLTDFEELKIFIVGGKPYIDEPQVGEWKSWHFRQYPLIARELWDLLARDRVAAGSIDAALDALPKKPAGKGKARQQWLIKPDRTRGLDSDFLEFLDETRRDLASDLYKHNDHDELLAGNRLTEACQRVIDRILFLRICEDRDIDTGERLQSIVEKWRKNTGHDDTGRRAHQQPFDSLREEPPADYGSSGIRAPKDSLWRAVVRHFRALDRRPPTHVPFFNGNLFKPHFTETLIIGDEWLAGFISELSADESPYLFSEIPVEILGSVYERFLGKVVVLKGRGISVDDKPEVRKAGGVYYTPRYIVDYIVEQTAGKLLNEIAGCSGAVSAPNDEAEGRRSQTAATTLKDFEKKTAALRLLDPACGSGSFLIRAFERVCEHWQKRLTADFREVLECASPLALSASPTEEKRQRAAAVQDATALSTDQKSARAAWQKKHRALCWLDESTGDIHLTVVLKRQILTQNIYGVDLDAAAVEVTQLSLYLKMLENENRTTLHRQRELLADETDIALLPPLQDNIKCGNSLIASDFSMMPEDLVRVHAFDWPVQFAPILKAGGFDAVIGNPPYGADFDKESESYIRGKFRAVTNSLDSFIMFVEQAGDLLNPKGQFGMIIPSGWVSTPSSKKLRERFAEQFRPTSFVSLPYDVFDGAYIDTIIVTAERLAPGKKWIDLKNTKVDLVVFPIRRKVEGQKDFDEFRRIGDCADWIGSPDKEFLVLSSREQAALVMKLRGSPVTLDSAVEVMRGIETYNPRPAKECKKPKRAFNGEMLRYELDLGPEAYEGYPPDIEAGKPIKFFSGPRILLRQLLSRKFRLQAVFAEDEFLTNQSVQSLIPRGAFPNIKFSLAVLNSRLISWFFCQFNMVARRDDFPKTIIKQTRELPFPKIDLKKPADKARHDKLVVLVDKLLGLMPKLRAATSDSEKAVLQNAVTASDQQIDALVYELYGLTKEEIKLVEGGEK